METVLKMPAAHGSKSTRRLDPRPSRPTTAISGFDGVDLEAIQGAVWTILRAVGEDPDRPGLLETPRRVAKMYAEMFAGLHQDPRDT